jgi:hypothetical protein
MVTKVLSKGENKIKSLSENSQMNFHQL